MLRNMLKPVVVPKCLWWWAPFPTAARRGYRVKPEPQIRGDAGDPATVLLTQAAWYLPPYGV